MTKFRLGMERALQAVLKALQVAGYTKAYELVKTRFYDPIYEQQEDWALKELFGLSNRELDALAKGKT